MSPAGTNNGKQVQVLEKFMALSNVGKRFPYRRYIFWKNKKCPVFRFARVKSGVYFVIFIFSLYRPYKIAY